jgi:hypothetical protein
MHKGGAAEAGMAGNVAHLLESGKAIIPWMIRRPP